MTELANHFKGIAVKRLSAVETTPSRSNQHEFNGIQPLRVFLGDDKRYIPASFIYLAWNEEERLSQESTLTWYDSRENDPNRSAEYRLYYTSDNEAMNAASKDDILIAALRHDETMMMVVVPADSPQLDEVLWFFGMSQDPGKKFTTIDAGQISPQSQALFNYVAESAGLEIEEEASDDWLEEMLARFGPHFPKTRELSRLARETLGHDINAIEVPDEALVKLIDREELLFRQLEKHIVSAQLRDKADLWADNVDEFMHFSLGVHNRRKSRAGHALENHLEWIFLENNVTHQRGAQTENRSKPDFLFPGSEKYQDPEWPSEGLTMLGVKTTCKDRWRQVLNEAQRIPEKHLLTLQPGISRHQTAEMSEARLTLVLPETLHGTYSSEQASHLMDLKDFISLVHERQRQAS